MTTVIKNQPVWDDHDWQALTRLEQHLTADVCVVGLGGSGLSAIHALLKRGKRVVGIDSGRVAGGAAGRNGGLLLAGTAAFYHDALQRLGRARAKAWYQQTLGHIDQMIQETPAAIRRVGSLRIATDSVELTDCHAQFEAMRQDDLPVNYYEGVEGQGLLFEPDAVFQPLLRCRMLAQQALEQGAQLFEQSPAILIQGHEVLTPEGRISCNQVIVAVDGRLERLFPELEGTVRTARLQMLATEPTNEIKLPRPVYARYGYEYWQQRPDGSIALGGFRDKAIADEWTTEARPSGRVQDLLEGFLRQQLGVQAPISHRWAASVSYKEDQLPYFAELRPKVWVMGAYSGTGNVIGALCGQAAAALVCGETTDFAQLLLSSYPEQSE